MKTDAEFQMYLREPRKGKTQEQAAARAKMSPTTVRGESVKRLLGSSASPMPLANSLSQPDSGGLSHQSGKR